jgi:hypothetical protein
MAEIDDRVPVTDVRPLHPGNYADPELDADPQDALDRPRARAGDEDEVLLEVDVDDPSYVEPYEAASPVREG